MKPAVCSVILLVSGLMVRPMGAQSTTIRIQAFNGVTGAPLAKQRLLIFAGATQEDAAFHHDHFDLTTSASGEATLLVESSQVRWFQVFADGLTLCQSSPNYRTFSVDQIIAAGLGSPNTCSRLTKPNQAGKFNVFARPSTMAEKMSR